MPSDLPSEVLNALIRARPSGHRLSPFLRFLDGVQLTDECVDAARQLGQEGDFMSGSAIGFGDDDRVNENRDNQVLRIVKLGEPREL